MSELDDRKPVQVTPPETTGPEEPEAARKAQFQKWFREAVRYLNDGQTDLAKTALERALSCSVDEDDARFFYEASIIYRSNGELDTALGFINRAIVARTDVPELLLEKGLVLEALQNRAYWNRAGNAPALLQQTRETLMKAVDLAAQRQNDQVRAKALGTMAVSLFYGQQKDPDRAEAFAQEAVRLGDPWGKGRQVLDALSRAENSQGMPPRGAFAGRQQGMQDGAVFSEGGRRAKRSRNKKKTRRILLAILAFLAIFALFFLGSLRSNLTDVGSHISYRFDSATGTLSISGKGEMRDFPTGLLLGHGLNWAPWEQSRNSYSDYCAVLAPIGFTESDVRRLELDERITYIGSEIFNFPNLSGELSIPEGVRAIGSCAFEGTGALEKVMIPGDIQAIATNAFSRNTTLVYDGSLEEWSRIGTRSSLREDYGNEPGGFRLRNAGRLVCSNAEIFPDEQQSGYRYSYRQSLLIRYDGTVEEFRSAFGWIDPNSSAGEDVARVECLDGTIDLTQGQTW